MSNNYKFHQEWLKMCRNSVKNELNWEKEWDKYFVKHPIKDEPLWVKIQREEREKRAIWEKNKPIWTNN